MVITMVRPRKVNPVPMTSISIAVKTWDYMNKLKPSYETWDTFINRVYMEWKDTKSVDQSNKNLREENVYLDDALQKAYKKIEEYVEVIDVLKKDQKYLYQNGV